MLTFSFHLLGYYSFIQSRYLLLMDAVILVFLNLLRCYRKSLIWEIFCKRKSSLNVVFPWHFFKVNMLTAMCVWVWGCVCVCVCVCFLSKNHICTLIVLFKNLPKIQIIIFSLHLKVDPKTKFEVIFGLGYVKVRIVPKGYSPQGFTKIICLLIKTSEFSEIVISTNQIGI